MATIGIIYNKITHLVLGTRQIEHILFNVNTSLRNEKMLENDIECDNYVNIFSQTQRKRYSDAHKYIGSRLLKMTLIIKLMTS